MASHFSTLGFRVKTHDDFFKLAVQAVKNGQGIEMPGRGSYAVWSPGAGIEIWAQVDQQGDIIGLNPYFAGQALMSVGLTRRVQRPDDTELDGAFFGWAGAPKNEPDAGVYPFAFDAPDYHMHSALQIPTSASVHLAAFAHEIKVYTNEAEFYAASKFAVESCIPSGTFHPGPKGGPIDPPVAEVIYNGRVLEAALRINPFTNLPFHWARIRTLGGEVDVVADPEIVRGTIVKDGVIHGVFWLAGRVRE